MVATVASGMIDEPMGDVSAPERLIIAVQELSLARSLDAIMAIVRRAAREVSGADGATFVLRDGDRCFYADEDAIEPLWKGKRFPMATCISGWCMLNREAAVIEDIYADPRIPADAYRPTFVKSLAMVPIRSAAPIGAIGTYWAAQHLAASGQVRLLQALADSTSVAVENVGLWAQLEAQADDARREEARQREVARENERLYQREQEVVRARDDFIAVVAHELRTPLTAVQLHLEALAGDAGASPPSGDGRVQLRAGRALGANQRLAALVERIIDVSAADAGKLVLEREPCDLRELTWDVVLRLAEDAARAGATLTVTGDEPVVGRWDRARLDQVVDSLVANAIKYGAGRPISLHVELAGPVARLRVADQGIGISGADALKIFERFGRVGPVEHYGGLGLGLYLARRLVEAHGGAIQVESAPGAGATFTVELPA